MRAVVFEDVCDIPVATYDRAQDTQAWCTLTQTREDQHDETQIQSEQTTHKFTDVTLTVTTSHILKGRLDFLEMFISTCSIYTDVCWLSVFEDKDPLRKIFSIAPLDDKKKLKCDIHVLKKHMRRPDHRHQPPLWCSGVMTPVHWQITTCAAGLLCSLAA